MQGPYILTRISNDASGCETSPPRTDGFNVSGINILQLDSRCCQRLAWHPEKSLPVCKFSIGVFDAFEELFALGVKITIELWWPFLDAARDDLVLPRRRKARSDDLFSSAMWKICPR